LVYLLLISVIPNQIININMKKLLVSLIAIACIASTLQAQTKLNTIKTDLFSPILRTYVLKYERALTNDISAQLGFFYSTFHPFDAETTLSGFGITPEFRFYLSDTPAPNGTYLAPNFRYMQLTAEDPNVSGEATLTNFSLAINIGKQVVLKDVIAIDAWVGPSYNFRSVEETVSGVDVGIPDINGFGLRIGLAIGLVF
jgi:hypothetical protein